ncbi:hypothetical protein [Clavibacter nebraskensis]|uniref:hypothetical protein n=1 Tax=Clavibacter nebraskensis TaxID=31963 RepID=UPI003F4BF8F1
MNTNPSNPNNGDEQTSKEGDTPTEKAVSRDTSLPNELTPLHHGQEHAHKQGSTLRDTLMRGMIAGGTRALLDELIEFLNP